MGCILVLLVKHVMLIIGIIRAMHNYYPGMNQHQLLQSCVLYTFVSLLLAGTKFSDFQNNFMIWRVLILAIL